MELKKSFECLHEDFLLDPAVLRTPNEETGKMDFVLVMKIRCSHCDSKFTFLGPVCLSENGLKLHIPIVRDGEVRILSGSDVGIS